MKNKLSRLIIVLFVIGICLYTIYPTFSWYFLMADDEKELLDKTNEELAKSKNRFIQKINDLKELIAINRDERNKKYHLLTVNDSDEIVPARSHKDKNIVFNIIPTSNKVNKYMLNTSEAVTKAIFGNNSYKTKEFIKLTHQAIKIRDEIQAALAFKALRDSIVKLGLDLNGGTHLTVSIDRHDLIKKLQKRYEQKGLLDGNSPESIVRAESVPDESKIKFNDALIIRAIKKDKKDIKPDDLKIALEKRRDELINGESEGYMNRSKGYLETVEDELTSARDNAITVIRNRIDKFGVSEVQLSKGLKDTIFIELPGLDKKSVELTKKTITEAGELVFRIVNRNYMGKDKTKIPEKYQVNGGQYRGYFSPAFVKQPEGKKSEDGKPPSAKPTDQFRSEEIREDMEKAGIVLSKGVDGTMLYPISSSDEFDNKTVVAYTLLLNKIEVEGRLLSDASVGYGEKGNPEVHFQFNSEGAAIFGETTGNNIGYKMAVVLDGMVMSDPVINSKISGKGVITLGKTSVEEVKQLVAVLKAGVLPSKLIISAAVTIGPTLGAENKKAGLFAIAIGFGIVIVFMLYYYRLAGFVAVIALFLNLFFLFAVLSSLGFALTLPGIAGIILTIGMAVDANVIIFERMREEIKHGRTHHALIDGAYEKGFSAIFDSNLTTILAAFILSNIGTGIIKGFGTTLMWGIIWSMFTALFVTRVIFDFLTDYLDQLKVAILAVAWVFVLGGVGVGLIAVAGFGTHLIGSDPVYQQIIAVIPIKDYLSTVSLYALMSIVALTFLGTGLGFIWSVKNKKVITLDLPFSITKLFGASKKDLKV